MTTGPSDLPRPVSAADDHIRGDLTTARVVIVTYGDFQCPFCRSAHRFLKATVSRHAAEVALVWRHLPMTQVHPRAFAAAVAAEAAARQDQFWPMHDRLFDDHRLSDDSFATAARDLGLDPRRFVADSAAPELAARVQGDRDEAVAGGLHGTPTLFVNDELVTDWRDLPTYTARFDLNQAPDPRLR